jgi:hypothetical protein
MRPSCCFGSFGSVFCTRGHKKGHTDYGKPFSRGHCLAAIFYFVKQPFPIPGLHGQTILVQRSVRHGRVWLCATISAPPRFRCDDEPVASAALSIGPVLVSAEALAQR